MTISNATRTAWTAAIGLVLVGLTLGPAVDAQDASFRFVAPERGASITSGDTVRVEVAGTGLREVMLVAPGFSETRQRGGNGNFVFQYTVPVATFGEVELTAFGKAEDDSFRNTSMTIDVAFNAERIEIDYLRVRPIALRIAEGESARLTVTATLDDGGELDVSDARFGTVYELAEGAAEDVAAVDENGNVQGLGPGEVELVVRHAKTDKPVPVRVVVSPAAAD